MATTRFTRIVIIATAALSLAGAAAYMAWRATKPDSGLIQVSGRIESDKVMLASKVMGRVVAIRVREGAETRIHETMALLDDRTTQAQLAESRAAVEATASQIASARSALAVLVCLRNPVAGCRTRAALAIDSHDLPAGLLRLRAGLATAAAQVELE
jgi:multidrug efflux pump subunit AcrA (membrane-fusion protein)